MSEHHTGICEQCIQAALNDDESIRSCRYAGAKIGRVERPEPGVVKVHKCSGFYRATR